MPIEAKTGENGIPYSWFIGVGRIDEGIMLVTPNENFYGPVNGPLYEHWANFTNYAGNPLRKDDPPERIERGIRLIKEAVEFIQEATGTHPLQVLKLSLLLTKMYKGKSEAPFPIRFV